MSYKEHQNKPRYAHREMPTSTGPRKVLTVSRDYEEDEDVSADEIQLAQQSAGAEVSPVVSAKLEELNSRKR